MNEDEEFWQIASSSGIADPDLGFALQDILSIIQTLTEASSWLSHTLSVGLTDTGAIPRYIADILVDANDAAREIITALSKCNCPGCRDLYGGR